MKLAAEFYKDNIERSSKESSVMSAKVNIVGWSRLAVLILVGLIDYFLYRENKIGTIIIVTIFLLGVFLGLVIYHNSIFEYKNRLDSLIKINKKGLKRISGQFREFKDKGIEYLEEEHSFANDLDVFGNSSIFQYINSTVTKGGREELAKLLKREKVLNNTDIKERQEAIRELGQKAKWRQNLIVEGKLKRSKDMDLLSLIKWSKKKETSSPLRLAIACTFIFVTVCSIYLIIKKIVPESFLILDLMVNFIVIRILSKSMAKEINLFDSIKASVNGYSKILGLIEDEKFDSLYLTSLSSKLNHQNSSCKEEMKKFSNILDWTGNSKYNAYYLIKID